jgi:Pectinacetylesterase
MTPSWPLAMNSTSTPHSSRTHASSSRMYCADLMILCGTQARDSTTDNMHAASTTISNMIMDSVFSGLFSLGLLVLLTSLPGGRAQTRCNYTLVDECPISGMSDAFRYHVYPGGNTRCYYSTPDLPNPYYFQVLKGRNADANNLIIYFQGGGVCTHNNIDDSLCLPVEKYNGTTLSASVLKATGGFLQRGADNPFGDWTSVVVSYCTGDVGIGDTVTADGLVHFNGRNNVKTVLSWVYENIPSPDRLLLAGASAGSFSLQFWANPIIQHYKESMSPPIITVVHDCYVGVNPPSNFAWESWDFCNQTDFGWSDETYEKCKSDNNFYNADVQLPVQQENRDTPFAFVTYKDDEAQRFVYWSSALPESKFPDWVIDKFGFDAVRNFVFWYGNLFVYTQSESYRDMRALIRSYTTPNNENNNVLSYFLNSPKPQHCAIDNGFFYSAGNGGGDPTLKDWMATLAYRDVGDGTTVKSSCTEEIDVKKRRDLFCDPALSGATFVNDQ